MPATLEAMRHLGTDDTLVFLYGACGTHAERNTPDADMPLLVDLIEAGGGRVDGYVTCNHGVGDGCQCWSDSPGMFWVPAIRFGLDLKACYVLADSAQDSESAHLAGTRPMLVLCSRSIGDVLGNQPKHKDYPIAVDLTTAVAYLATEDEIVAQLGHPREEIAPAPPSQVLYADPGVLPRLTVVSPLAHERQARVTKSRAERRDIVRWLSFFVAGALGLSLGVAYLLTHLYRMQPFPRFVYYLTLQFISRPIRGLLFIAIGIAVIYLAVRRFFSLNEIWRRRRT
jgi:hypothetical protein